MLPHKGIEVIFKLIENIAESIYRKDAALSSFVILPIHSVRRV